MKTLEGMELTAVRRTPQSQVSTLAAHAVCALAVLVGIALRFANLGRESLWFDEGYTAWAISNPVKEVIRVIRVDTAPPLYYLLLRGWSHLFGFSELALRSMSALMSCIGLLVCVAIAGKLLKSAWAVAMAAILFSFSFMQIGYAHEARFYAMMTMMGAIDFYLVLLMCQRSSPARIVAVTLAWAVSLWTNNMMAVYLACLGLAWLILPGKRTLAGRLIDATIVTVLAGLIFLPWLPTLLAQTQQIQTGFWPSRPDASLLFSTIGFLAGVNEQGLLPGNSHGFVFLDVLIAVLMVTACFSARGRRTVIGLGCFGLLPIGLIFIYSRVGQSIFMERAFLATGVVMPLLIVLPIDLWSKGRLISIAPAGLIILLSLASLRGHRLGDHTENWRAASVFANSGRATHRLVVCVSSDGEPLYRYYGCHRDYKSRSDVTAVPASFFAIDPPRTMQRVKSDRDLDSLRQLLATQKFDEVVLLESHEYWADRTERVRIFLSADLHETQEKMFTGIKVFRFEPRAGDRLN